MAHIDIYRSAFHGSQPLLVCGLLVVQGDTVRVVLAWINVALPPAA